MLQISEPGQSKKKRVAIGIDLGTTYSLVAVYQDSKAQILPVDDAGHLSLPSMVLYDSPNAKTCGIEAELEAKNGAKNVFFSMKRLMGKGKADSSEFSAHVPFEISGTSEQAAAKFNDIEKSAVEVSADILSYLKNQAEKSLGEAVHEAVITVPAYFNDAQRQATKDAAKLAGLNVLRLISEPTAAALAYGLDKKAKGQFLIYDLGGGTFDVSLLKLTDGVFRVIATGGDTYLGGDDIDIAIAKALNISPLEARRLKETEPEKVSEYAKPILEKTLDIAEQVLEDAELGVDDLEGIVLVGGSTKLPLVRDMVESYFDMKPEEGINPDHVVAHGAALQAHALTSGKRENMLLLDVTPLSLGLETMGGLVEKVIERNTAIPITKAQKFTTFKDGQTAMDIHVLQGERETVEGNRSLAKFRLSGIPPMAAGAARILVKFSLDADGMLTVSAEEESAGVIQTVDVVPSYGMKPEQMLEMLKDSIHNAKSDVMLRQLKESHIELERVIDACGSALEKDGHMLENDEQERLQVSLKEARNFLTSKNRDDVESAMEELEKAFQNFSETRVNNALKKAIVGQSIFESDERK